MNRLLPFMKHPGAGKTAAKDLSRDDSREAMTALLEGAYHPVTFGSFFLALRFKGETAEEMAGFLDAMAGHLIPVRRRARALPNLLDCAPSYDGKVRTLNVGVAASVIAVGAGARILLQGSEEIPTKQGMTTAHVLERLGIGARRTPDQAVDELEACGIAYLHQPDFHPRFHALLPDRQQVGKRTVLNSVEPLSNPLGARAHLGGFFHDAYGPLTCRAGAEARNGFDRIVMVKGIEGSDELRPGGMHFVEWRDGEMKQVPVDSGALGLDAHISDLGARPTQRDELADASAAAVTGLLDGNGSPGYRNMALLNAAVRLYAAGCVEQLGEGIERARRSLESGTARRVLQAWQSAAARSDAATPVSDRAA